MTITLGTTRAIRRNQPNEVYLITREIRQHGSDVVNYGGRRWNWTERKWEGELFIGCDFIKTKD
jgi:hypothetical protein